MKMWQKILLTIIVLIVISLLVFLYSKYIGAKMFYVKEYPLYSTTIDNSYNGLKIAHLSDIHYGLGMTKNDLEKIVKDVVFFVGVCENYEVLPQISEVNQVSWVEVNEALSLITHDDERSVLQDIINYYQKKEKE